MFGDLQVTYRELNAKANQLAHFLLDIGLCRGEFVGIFLERSTDVLVGMLAVLKAGGSYVPLDPAYSSDRLRLMLEDAGVKTLISQEHLRTAFPASIPRIICLDSDWHEIETSPASDPSHIASSDDIAYVVFTSGSTGRPKGVPATHKAVVNVLSFMARELRMGPSDVFPALASVSWDMSVAELFLALITGGRVLIVGTETASNGRELAALLKKSGATIVHATPSTWSLLADAGFYGKGLKSIFGAEPLPHHLCTKLLEADQSLYNFYGPTETTIWSSFNSLGSIDELAVIGRPIDNTRIYILDQQLRPVPSGVHGEIYIGGVGLSAGYLDRPDLTASSFMPDPFSRIAGASLYKTGDKASLLPDGRIVLLGRADNQVKIRGFRIELGEIEASIEQHWLVRQCIVVAREGTVSKQLVAYVLPKPGMRIAVSHLRSWLKDRLPQYMVPAIWIEMPSLPLLPTGKVDRSRLPTPEALSQSDKQVEGDDLERILGRIWRRVLQNPDIGIHDDFFDVGGHSLLAVQLVAQIELAVGRKIPLSLLFRGTTIVSLARLLREHADTSSEPLVMEIEPGKGDRVFFAVAAPGVRTLGYAMLARRLGPDWGFFKLQAQGPIAQGRLLTASELRSLAAQYIAAMKAVQPNGPYYLGGMCAGCRIAEQMILQLETAGDEVALFAVFDTWVLENVNRPWLWRIFYCQQRLKALRKMSARDRWQVLKRAAKHRYEKTTRDSHSPTEWEQILWPKDFTPQRFHAPVAVFKRNNQPFYYRRDPEMGWGRRTLTGVKVHELAVKRTQHLELLREPCVQVLGQELAACLDAL